MQLTRHYENLRKYLCIFNKSSIPRVKTFRMNLSQRLVSDVIGPGMQCEAAHLQLTCSLMLIFKMHNLTQKNWCLCWIFSLNAQCPLWHHHSLHTHAHSMWMAFPNTLHCCKTKANLIPTENLPFIQPWFSKPWKFFSSRITQDNLTFELMLSWVELTLEILF